MSTLFIIGNGFDLAHCLPTSYNHFKEYLRTEYEYNYDEMPQIWEQSSITHSGSEEYDMKNCAHIIDYLVSNAEESMTSEYEWKDFEKALGKLNLREIEDEIYDQYDKEGDINPFKTGYLYEDAYSDLEQIMMFVQKLFQEWINTIKVPEQHYSLSNMYIYETLKELFANVEDPIFLTFNYTDTLEILYKEENIIHIHGDLNNPIVGHGDETVIDKLAYNQDEYINRISEQLRKPCESIIESNYIFFENLENNITDIYTYGFSFSDVDGIYIKEILKRMDTKNVVWYLQSYDLNNHEEYKDKLLKYGFKGKISIF
ncbi:bacteriophage abortive infection AbiH family protein [Vagococcus fluvialis]|uniref:bacteriophage abortive infection AbiH family protein n=1 Tax=Vagococcus fluvialis TaxID=2738 RepID=UPI003D0F0C97